MTNDNRSIPVNDIDFENLKVNYVLPFSNHDNGGLMAIAGIYAMLFMLGTCGNSAILAVVHHVRSTDPRARHNTTLSYICVLSIVDFISMLPLPMTIIDQVLGFWMFGTFACKLFRLFEHISKIFSTFILVCFSIDRYCAVCHPLQVRLRTSATANLMLCTTFALTCILLCPILIFAQSKEIVVHEKYDRVTNEVTRLHLYKCVDDLSNELFILFTLTCFLFAYLVPLLLMIYFYYGMLMRLVKQSRAARRTLVGARRSMKGSFEEKIPVARIAVYTLAICLFHFVCWTPYWTSVLYSLYLEVFQPPDLQMPDSSFIYFMYGVHALPYINSASNFILYGLLNRQLHQAPDRRFFGSGTFERRLTTRHPPTLRPTECTELCNLANDEHRTIMSGVQSANDSSITKENAKTTLTSTKQSTTCLPKSKSHQLNGLTTNNLNVLMDTSQMQTHDSIAKSNGAVLMHSVSDCYLQSSHSDDCNLDLSEIRL